MTEAKYYKDHGKTKGKRKINLKKYNVLPAWQKSFRKILYKKINISINLYHPENEDQDEDEKYIYVAEVSKILAELMDYFLKIIARKIAIRMFYSRTATV